MSWEAFLRMLLLAAPLTFLLVLLVTWLHTKTLPLPRAWGAYVDDDED